MNITIENNIYSLIATARSSWVSSHSGKDLGNSSVVIPSDTQIINETPPLGQQIQALRVQEFTTSSSQNASQNNGSSTSGNDTNNQTNTPYITLVNTDGSSDSATSQHSTTTTVADGNNAASINNVVDIRA